MVRLIFSKQTFFTFVLALAGCIASVNAQTVTGSIAGGSVKRGTPAKATVYLNIPGGLHANSTRPGSEYAIPTRVTVNAKGLKIGPVSYPKGRDRKFEFSDKALNVYEGKVPFTFNVTVPAGYKGASISLTASVHYQACTNEVCYPPNTKTVKLTALVR